MNPSLTAVAFILAFAAVSRAADETPAMDIWPAGVCKTQRKEPEKLVSTNKVSRYSNVSTPTITLRPAPKDKATGAAVIVCPGGGYSILAWDLEGLEIADWLNSIGVSAVVLKYRVPEQRQEDANGFAPLMDAQRTISLVRSKAAEWGINPKKIGILGFSAGGNLTALACTNFEHRSYAAADEVDQVSCRPDFGVLVYPAYLLKDKSNELTDNLPISEKTPPCFFVHADNDRISSAGSAVMYLAFKRAGVPSELHIYTQGGHGFGLRPTPRPCCQWPTRCEEWMRSTGIIPPAEKN